MKKLIGLFALGFAMLATAALAAPISTYPNASTPLNGSEASIGTQGAGTVQITTGSISTLANSPGVRAAYPAASSPLSGTETVAGTQSGATVKMTTAQIGTVATSQVSFSLQAYGAVCDGATDDSSAINAMFTAIRSAVTSGNTSNYPPAINIIGPATGKPCVIKNAGINATGLFFAAADSHTKVSLSFNGVSILCEYAGGVCFDMTADRAVTVNTLVLNGSCTSGQEPTIGVQLARKSATTAADDDSFDHLSVWGCFTFTPFYDVQAENMTALEPTFNNSDTSASGTAFAGPVLDGPNHWGLASAYQTVTLPTNTSGSFNEQLFVGMQVFGSASGPAMWLSGVSHSRFIDAYDGITYTGPNVILYQISGATGQLLDDVVLDLHQETTSPAEDFLISGTNAAPGFINFDYIDQGQQANGPVFKIDSGSSVTSVTFQGNNLVQLANMRSASTQVFDSAMSPVTIYEGDLQVPAWTNLSNMPNNFSGCVTVFFPAGASIPTPARQCNTQPTSDNMIINGDFGINQVAEASTFTATSGGMIADGWRATEANTAAFSFITSASSSPAPFPRNELAESVNAETPGSTDGYNMYQNVEGPRGQALGWGAAGANYVTLAFTAFEFAGGTYCVAIQNSAANKSYVIPFVIPANAYTHFAFQVPGPTSGTWVLTSGGTFLSLVFDLGSGSSFETASPNTWASGNYSRTSGCAKEVTKGGNFQLQISGVQIHPGNLDLIWQPNPAIEWQNALRRYVKTFPPGTVAAQGVATGAICVQAPFAASNVSYNWEFPVPMAAAPSVTTFNPVSSNNKWYDTTATADITSALGTPTATGVPIYSGGTSATAGNKVCIGATAAVSAP